MATIDAPAELYRTATILSGMANLPRASVFLRDKLFSKVVTAPTDQVDISFYNGKAKLVPYCSRFAVGTACSTGTPAIAALLTTIHEAWSAL